MNNLFPAGAVNIGEDTKQMQEFINKSLRNKVVVKEKTSFFPRTYSSADFVFIDEKKIYRLYPDGKIFSSYIGRNLKPIVLKRRGKPMMYRIRKKTVYVNRLVMFYFGNHDYKRIEDIPMVSPIDKNPKHNHISNLEFIEHGGLNVKYNQVLSPNFVKKPKIPATEIENIKSLISKEMTYDQIGSFYNASGMSVSRFVRRHSINWVQVNYGNGVKSPIKFL